MVKRLYSLFLSYPKIVTDSRVVTPGSLFFALKGDRFNGNSFAKEALGKGAVFAVIDDPACKTDEQCILVENTLSTLQQLALYHRNTLTIPVIAITGSNGKTTTKELTSKILSTKFKTVATQGNLNNHIGVPLSILAITPETQIAVIEMGANHQGEIRTLCEIARPSYGLITNIGRAHLEGFGGLEGVLCAKTELFEFLKAGGGQVFINASDRLLQEKSRFIQKITYGFDETPWIQGKLIPGKSSPLQLYIHFPGGIERMVSSKLFGAYNATNILAAACIGHYFKVPEKEICSAIEGYSPSNNRSQLSSKGGNLLILDMYNANPSSMEAALTEFAATEWNEKAVIIGDMLELGKDEEDEHIAILDLLEDLQIHHVFLIGPVFTKLNRHEEWISFNDSEIARTWFEHHPFRNASVLIKGSRGIKLERIAEVL